MVIECDATKRQKTLENRGIDFHDAPLVFSGKHFTASDERIDYGEPRFITIGFLRYRVAVIVWTPRKDTRRIISMRYANEREIKRYKKYLG